MRQELLEQLQQQGLLVRQELLEQLVLQELLQQQELLQLVQPREQQLLLSYRKQPGQQQR